MKKNITIFLFAFLFMVMSFLSQGLVGTVYATYTGACTTLSPSQAGTSLSDSTYQWQADCSKKCSTNSECKQNTFDINNVAYTDPPSSNWCYGFSDGSAPKCTMLVRKACKSVTDPGCNSNGNNPRGNITCSGTGVTQNGSACTVSQFTGGVGKVNLHLTWNNWRECSDAGVVQDATDLVPDQKEPSNCKFVGADTCWQEITDPVHPGEIGLVDTQGSPGVTFPDGSRDVPPQNTAFIQPGHTYKYMLFEDGFNCTTQDCLTNTQYKTRTCKGRLVATATVTGAGGTASPSPSSPSSVTLSGRVTDESGNGIASVDINSGRTCGGLSHQSSMVTDASGRFSASVAAGAGFCLRPPAVPGYTLTSPAEGGYEWQIAGQWCGGKGSSCSNPKIACGSSETGLDLCSDNSYNFTYTRSASASPSPTAPTSFTTSFRIAENLADLGVGSTVRWEDYTSGAASGAPVSFTFKDTTPGVKTVFVQFKGTNGKVGGCGEGGTSPCQAQITLLGSPPQVSSCALAIDGANTVLTLTGTDFGSAKGSAAGTVSTATSATALNIGTWTNTGVTATWPNAPAGQTLNVTLTTADGQTADPASCSSISQLALGAKVFCRQPSFNQTDNVELILAGTFEGGKKVKEKVSIDRDGVVQGLTQKLVTGQTYGLSLKAPKGLRTTTSFTARDGTTQVPDLMLPVGDIFPRGSGDARINSQDRSELVREWNSILDTTGRDGDFNQDSRVNSLDWACMRISLIDANGRTDDPEPASGPVSAGSAGLGSSAPER